MASGGVHLHTNLNRRICKSDPSIPREGINPRLALDSLQLADPVFQYLLNPNIEQQATHFLFNNFTFPSQHQNISDGFLKTTVNLYQQQEEGSSLQFATHAVALATIGSWPDYYNVVERGQRLYIQALSAIQRTLHDPARATSDAALATIILLSLYESATGSIDSVVAWSRHIDGAVAIVRARGEAQFDSPQSLSLFRAVRTQMLLLSMQTQRPVPSLSSARGWMSDMREENGEVPFSFLTMALEVTSLLSRLKKLLTVSKSLRKTREVECLLAQAQELQYKRIEWDYHLPKEWSYQSTAVMTGVVNEESAEVVEAWPGPIHSYRDAHIASTLNNHRICSISCAGIVKDAIKLLRPNTYLDDPEYRFAKSQIQCLVDDVCSSVPYQLSGHWLSVGDEGDDRDTSGEQVQAFVQCSFNPNKTDSHQRVGSVFPHLATVRLFDGRLHSRSPKAMATWQAEGGGEAHEFSASYCDGRGEPEGFGEAVCAFRPVDRQPH